MELKRCVVSCLVVRFVSQLAALRTSVNTQSVVAILSRGNMLATRYLAVFLADTRGRLRFCGRFELCRELEIN